MAVRPLPGIRQVPALNRSLARPEVAVPLAFAAGGLTLLAAFVIALGGIRADMRAMRADVEVQRQIASAMLERVDTQLGLMQHSLKIQQEMRRLARGGTERSAELSSSIRRIVDLTVAMSGDVEAMRRDVDEMNRRSGGGFD